MATKAVNTCNNIPVDGKPIKVEMIIDANLAKAIPAPKGLSERITYVIPSYAVNFILTSFQTTKVAA